MCFHYSLTVERAQIEIQLHAVWDDAPWQPVFHANGFQFPNMPVITQEAPTRIRKLQWGLIPAWVKDAASANEIQSKTLNARAETLFEKPSFRSSILHQRCLVIADGFFEWMEYQKKKYPHYIYLKQHRLFCFAGIYSNWIDEATGEMITSFSIITTDANPMMQRIHNTKKRMPLIIEEKDFHRWLSPDINREEIGILLQPFGDRDMEGHTISRLITSRTQDSNVAEVTEEFIYPELQLL